MTYYDRTSYHTKRVGQSHYKVLASAIQRAAPNVTAALDVGCSAGSLLGHLSAQCRVGIDVSLAAKSVFEAQQPECVFRLYDLERDDYWLGQFDLIVCMEVPEHVRNHGNLLRLLDESAASPCTLVWSAAPLGQRGAGHVNLKPYRWWRRKLEAMDWRWDVAATDKFARTVAGKVPRHYEVNTRIYRK